MFNLNEIIVNFFYQVVLLDYPKPMIDHVTAGKHNQERMKQVYQQLSTYRNIKTPEVQDQPVNR